MATIPTHEPASIVAGTTVSWKISNSDYPAPTYFLHYTLVKYGDKIAIVSAASGADHLIEIAPATSADYEKGTYRFQAVLANDETLADATDVHHLYTGTIEIKTDFPNHPAGFDPRSHAETALDAIEAIIEGRATEAHLSYSIGGRSFGLMTLEELWTARSKFRAEVERERQAERVEQGLPSKRLRKVRFTG